MANSRKKLQFTYDTNTYEIDIPLSHEDKQQEDIMSTLTALSGKTYQQITGEKTVWVYKFNYCTKLIYDFFYNAYVFAKSGGSVLFLEEQDDGSFVSYSMVIERPKFNDDTLTDIYDDKIYSDFTARIAT